MNNKKVKYSLVLFLIVFLVTSYYGAQRLSAGKTDTYLVTKVIDGDTIEIDDKDNSRVRLIGINTPELINYNQPGEPFAKEARKLTEKLVLNKKVELQYEEEKYDFYGRVLAYVFIDGLFLNAELLRNGLARSFIFRDKGKYKRKLLNAENKAKRLKIGIWGNLENFEYPAGNLKFLINTANSQQYIDEKVFVSGEITDTGQNKKVVILEINNNLDIVIFKDNLDNFKHFNINPMNYYDGKVVEVVGRVKMYRGKPQILVHHPITIRVVK